jgi:glycosyltransferase involved in cell wall biosynthesis
MNHAPSRADGRPRSILFLNHNWRARATYFRNFNLARILAVRGWDATVMTTSPQRSLRVVESFDRGVRVVEMPWFLSNLRYGATGCCPWDILRRAMKMPGRRYDVYFVSDHLPNVSLPYWFAKKFHPDALFVADWADLFTDGGVHGHLNRSFTKPVYNLSHRLEYGLKRATDLCTVTSRPLLKKLIEQVGVPAERALLLPSGCDTETPAPPARDAARKKLELPADALIIGRTTSTTYMFAAEIPAYLKLWERFKKLTDRELIFYFVGPCKQEDYPQIFRSGFPVRTTGRVPAADVATHLAACDLFVMIEDDKPFNHFRGPIRLNDYLTVGRPLICNSIGDHVPTLKQHNACVIYDDFTAPNAALDQILTDVAEREAMGKRARALAEGELNWTTLGRRLDEFLREKGRAKLEPA